MSTDFLNVPVVSTRRRLSDALLQVVPNFPANYHSPVSKLAKTFKKHMGKDSNVQPVRPM